MRSRGAAETVESLDEISPLDSLESGQGCDGTRRELVFELGLEPILGIEWKPAHSAHARGGAGSEEIAGLIQASLGICTAPLARNDLDPGCPEHDKRRDEQGGDHADLHAQRPPKSWRRECHRLPLQFRLARNSSRIVTANGAYRIMDWRNRIGLYGSYFFGVAGIGFTLPYLPLCLGQEGLSDRTIGLISTLAALGGLAQFPVGLWSDRIGRRKPFLLVALALVAGATVLLRDHHHAGWLAGLLIREDVMAYLPFSRRVDSDRLADSLRSGEAQVIVGSCLVLGSAIGPAAAGFLFGPLGYRGLFAALAGLGASATAIVAFWAPETLPRASASLEGHTVEPMAAG